MALTIPGIGELAVISPTPFDAEGAVGGGLFQHGAH